MSRKKPATLHTVLIETKFGSSFQEDSFTSALVNMLSALASFYGGTHKSNSVAFVLDGQRLDANSPSAYDVSRRDHQA